jgi:hypothetical protein
MQHVDMMRISDIDVRIKPKQSQIMDIERKEAGIAPSLS